MQKKSTILIAILASVSITIILTHLIPLDFRNHNEALNNAEVALQSAADSNSSRFYALTDATEAAFEAGEFVKARKYAVELLQLSLLFQDNWNYGNAVHYAHIALGRVALSEGDLVKAKSYLFDAGRTPGSPQLKTAGPDMTLARELLKKGERDAVLRYLEQCEGFWKSGRSKLILWGWEVRLGLIPAFNRF